MIENNCEIMYKKTFEIEAMNSERMRSNKDIILFIGNDDLYYSKRGQ